MGKAKKFKELRKIEKAERLEKRKKVRKMTLRVILYLVLITVASFGVFKATVYIKDSWSRAAKKTEKKVENKAKSYSKAPEMKIDVNKKYIAKFDTDAGSFVAELNAKEVPKTVNNFVFLARDGFYDGLTFHRVVKDFMIQGGDPAGTGSGGPGYKFDDEKFSQDYTPGTLAMANSGANTNGSQFFVMTTDYSGKLPKNYTIFGKVTSGMDVVTKLAATQVKDNGQGENSLPVKAPQINKITIEEK